MADLVWAEIDNKFYNSNKSPRPSTEDNEKENSSKPPTPSLRQSQTDLGISAKIYNTPESLSIEEAYKKIYSTRMNRGKFRTQTPTTTPTLGKNNNRFDI